MGATVTANEPNVSSHAPSPPLPGGAQPPPPSQLAGLLAGETTQPSATAGQRTLTVTHIGAMSGILVGCLVAIFSSRGDEALTNAIFWTIFIFALISYIVTEWNLEESQHEVFRNLDWSPDPAWYGWFSGPHLMICRRLPPLKLSRLECGLRICLTTFFGLVLAWPRSKMWGIDEQEFRILLMATTQAMFLVWDHLVLEGSRQNLVSGWTILSDSLAGLLLVGIAWLHHNKHYQAMVGVMVITVIIYVILWVVHGGKIIALFESQGGVRAKIR